MFTIINGNARSLQPKLESFIDCFNNSEASVGVVTETWLDGEPIEEELSEEHGIGFISRNRTQRATNDVRYGGVAVAWRESHASLKRLDINNPEDKEVLVATGKINGHIRKMVVLACYLPPGYSKKRGEGALDFINETIVSLKQKCTDPYIIIAGDFNQWQVADPLLDFPDIREAAVGPTRGTMEIDKIFTNLSRSISEAGSLVPLETADGTCQSNHKVVFCKAAITKMRTFKWETTHIGISMMNWLNALKNGSFFMSGKR